MRKLRSHLTYANVMFNCDDNGTPAEAADDKVVYGNTQQLGAGALASIDITVAPDALSPATTSLLGPAAVSGNPVPRDDRMSVRHYLLTPNGSKQTLVEGHAFEDEASTTECTGWLRAIKIR